MADNDLEIRPHRVYTLSEVRQIFQVSDATLRRWLKDGKLRSARVGRAYRFLGSQLLEAFEAPAASEPARADRTHRR